MQLQSRINGGGGIRVNLLGTHGPGFVSETRCAPVGGENENENDSGGQKHGEQSLFWFVCFCHNFLFIYLFPKR